MTATRTDDLAAIITVRLWCQSGRAREIREASGLTLAEIGALAGASPQAVYRWEMGQRTPRGGNAAQYYKVLVRAEELTASAKEPMSR
jgi:transcriptional regulator with XRE-family HTH domain